MKVGDTVGNLKILSFSHKIGRNRYFNCRCRNCGSVVKRAISNLYQKLKFGKRGTCEYCQSEKHPLYLTWKSMVNRCHNRNNSSCKHYGGRGISVCDRWRKSFWDFYEDMGDRPEGYTLDRINNDGNYSKDNCRWATIEQQSRNTRTNVTINYKGNYITEAELSRLTGTPRTTIQSRRRRGLTRWEDLVNDVG